MPNILSIKKTILSLVVFLFFIGSIGVQAQPNTTPQLPLSPQLASPPQRIASLNICLDQLLWELVPRERLVSISYLTASPMWSPIAEQVRGIPTNHGLAEEIVPLSPDIILAGEFDAASAVELLNRLGNPVTRLPLPRKLSDINQQIIELGDLVGAGAKARTMAARISAQVAELQAAKQFQQPLTAFWYSSNGVVIGDGTLEHELMQLAGLRNLAAERGMFGFNQLDLELLLSAKPQILIMEASNAEGFSLAREYLAHPALANAGFDIVRLPAGLSGCATSVLGDVAIALKHELAK